MKIRKSNAKDMNQAGGVEDQGGEMETKEELEEEKGAEAKREGKTIAVAVKMDSQSRELLTWVLVKLAVPGDLVIALHVLSSSSASSSSSSSSAQDFASMLAVYEGFCNLKQIDLKLKICKGSSSIRKALVGEVRSFKASKLILGAPKNNRGVGYSSVSIAKYCAKKLPCECAVLAVSNGKIIFQREENDKRKVRGRGLSSSFISRASGRSTKDLAKFPGCWDNDLYCELPVKGQQGNDSRSSEYLQDGDELNSGGICTSQPTKFISETQQKDLPCGKDGDLYCLFPIKDQGRDDAKLSNELKSLDSFTCSSSATSRSASFTSEVHRQESNNLTELPINGDGDLYCLLPFRGHLRSGNDIKPSTESNVGVSCCSSVTDDVSSVTNASPRKICSVCTLVPDPSCSNEFMEDEPPNLVLVQRSEASSSLSIASPKELPEGRSGRTLLRKTILTHKRSASFDLPKVSVLKWAMRLPSRYSAIHPDSKSIKSDADTKLDYDSDSGVILAETDSPPCLAFPNEDGRDRKELEVLQEKYSSVCRLFSYEELSLATSDFSDEKLIGKGGSSRVYKACFLDGNIFAVKILKTSGDALKEFVSEIEILTALCHKNIISLLGFCFENNSLMLVYNYLPRGSLEEIIHGEQENRYVLSWAERYKVAIGVAEGLHYLHIGGTVQPVIHRDVKSSNILLSEDFEPQLSDFGLAKWVSSSASDVTCTDVAGTFGYLAPEYFMYGKVNEKIDVYAFGVVLLELISGRKPIRTGCPKGQESLVMWAKPILQGQEIKRLVDPCLGNEYNSEQMERLTLAASICIRMAYQSRPGMDVVLKLLQGDEDVVKWARLEVSASEGFDGLDGEVMIPDANIRSHLNLALLDIEDDSLSISSTEQTIDSLSVCTSMEDYAKERWSRSSSFD
ncbi:uncharacterized protein [Typha latifolia]|uniref:uncharacterized protein n=1 Tax=Typha latifolia TaxID=4733 RepID=UPI003C2C77CE